MTILKYFEPPKKVLRRSRDALEECKTAFAVNIIQILFEFSKPVHRLRLPYCAHPENIRVHGRYGTVRCAALLMSVLQLMVGKCKTEAVLYYRARSRQAPA